jgi:hypothetical protein
MRGDMLAYATDIVLEPSLSLYPCDLSVWVTARSQVQLEILLDVRGRVLSVAEKPP